MEKPGCPAKSGMGPLYDPPTRAPHSAVQTPPSHPEVNINWVLDRPGKKKTHGSHHAVRPHLLLLERLISDLDENYFFELCGSSLKYVFEGTPSASPGQDLYILTLSTKSFPTCTVIRDLMYVLCPPFAESAWICHILKQIVKMWGVRETCVFELSADVVRLRSDKLLKIA